MKKNNVAFIVLDDMGFSDLGCFGAEIDTKNLDALAYAGVRFNNFSACPACSPTRASLLTGREHNSVGMGHIANMVLGESQPDIQGRIKHEAGTIAQNLLQRGYSTLAVGKWHVAPIHHETPAGPFDYWPLNKGFQRYYGYLDGETDQYAPQLIYDNHAVDPPRRTDYHLSEDLVTKSIEFVSDTISVYPDKPFFLYLCFGVAHSPHQVPREYIERYKGVYDVGWDVIREQRFQRQKDMGVVPLDTVCSPRDPEVKCWDGLTAEQKTLYTRFQETYAGYVTHCDDQVGRLIQFFKDIGEYDNTIFVVLSDNGASRDGGIEGLDDFYRSLNGTSPSFEDLYARIDDIGGPELKALYPKGWAMVGNTPFREYKGTHYGGGIRTPMFIRWDEASDGAGQIRNQMTCVEDIYPTILDILEFDAPKVIGGVCQMPIHGYSFKSVLLDGTSPEARKMLFRRWANSFSMVCDGWKALSVHKPGNSFEEDPWQLYHLAEDFSESCNVAEQYPDILDRLKQLWWSEAEKYITMPPCPLSPRDFAYVPADSPEARRSFRLLPKTGRLGSSADPPMEKGNHTINVVIERQDPNDQGVLLALGGVSGGCTLFVLDNRLYYDLNNFYTHYIIESDRELPLGRCEVKFAFEKISALTDEQRMGFMGDHSSELMGVGTLYIDGQVVGSRVMETVRTGYAIEGTDIGRDSMTPVCPLYKELGDFSFGGKLLDIRVEVDR